MPKTTVHVFSCIPTLSQQVQKQLPHLNVITVNSPGVCRKYGNVITEKDLTTLQHAEILLVDNNLLAQMLYKLPRLQWAQGTWAGVEGLMKECIDQAPPQYPVTRMAAQSFSQLMSEYTLGWIITHERNWMQCRQNQLSSEWIHEGQIAYYRSISDLTIGVMGMGIIGKEVARCLKCFGGTVHAFTRTPPTPDNTSQHVDKYRHTGELKEFLQECDYIVNIMPSTPDTKEMLGNDILSNAKKDAVLINIGRGDVIGEGDLIKALDYNWLSAAILDVFNTEPLPSNSELWLHPKVWITPHSAGVSRSHDVCQAFVNNFNRFTNSEPLLNVINWQDGY
ncbi:hypothetical protein Pcinc_003108 [Petrolisthes cinctipes]|uniref:D-isomer specific 2-hydroxyacid dehydrogenase NAD-binding domain-containing protein n=1 Tax=Petrolisthes cinctipes TaxID=88211 RepID=A0AAE1L2T4_PETCI|nr:hypothetical protein Pcinc_003108 [Petrolisthes cinctipes]